MDTFFSILGDEECRQIWDRIDEALQFRPSVRANIRSEERRVGKECM